MKNIIGINNLDQILTSENTLYHYNNLFINVYRVKNDIYGNPLYHLSIYNENLENITKEYKGKLGRYYSKKEFLSVQSYNLSSSINYILGE
jgi:hypothetical protein